MRLIDADKIDFGNVFIGTSDFAKDTREAAQNLINAQPTAYDVDRVIKQIRQIPENYSDNDIDSMIDDAVEIVREEIRRENEKNP